jgi:hypothetical protein
MYRKNPNFVSPHTPVGGQKEAAEQSVRGVQTTAIALDLNPPPGYTLTCLVETL